MPRMTKRKTLIQVGSSLNQKIHRELSEMCWALDRTMSDVLREMIENDLPRFKDRHRQAIRDGEKSEESHEGSHGADSEAM